MTFSFNEENLQRAEAIIRRYPAGRQKSAVMPLLDLAQQQNGGWLNAGAIEYMAEFLSMAPIRVYEVATFYSMFNLKPVGTYHIQVCGTTPCWLRGGDEIMKTCQNKLGIKSGEITKNNKFSLTEVECLGACVNAPVVQINDDFFEDLTQETMSDLIDKMENNEIIKKGSQVGRHSSEAKISL